jgi:hypothetical protein
MDRPIIDRVISSVPTIRQRLWQPPPSRRRPTFRPVVESLETRLTPSVTFAAQQTFGVGSGVVAEAVGDFNGDGRPDLVVANAATGTVSVLLNTARVAVANIPFAAPQTIAFSTNPVALAVADFNGDGRPDIVVIDGNAVMVLLNTTAQGAGTVTFAAPRTFAVGAGPDAVAVADFDADGRPDLAVANKTDGTVSVLLNTTPAKSGTPFLAAQQTFAVGAGPDAIAAADFNGDGRPDLAVVNEFGDTVSVLLNEIGANGALAPFGAQQTLAVGSAPWSVAVADFNSDGRPDLAVTNLNDHTVSVLLNQTSLFSWNVGFAAQQTFAVGSGPVAVAAADLDGDGLPDLAVANVVDSTVSVLVNTTPAGSPTPSFAAQQTFATGHLLTAVNVADFNGDGRTDLAVDNQTDGTVGVLYNTTTPFQSSVPVVVGQFGGSGVMEFNRTTGIMVTLTAANAKLLAANPLGDVVGEFPGHGVWEYLPAFGWKQINGIDADALAIDPNGDVTADFPGYGVGEYLPFFGWRPLTGADASLLGMDALGDIVGEFPGYGVWEARPESGWTQINGQDATLLAMSAGGAVVANFKSVGVGEYLPYSGWQGINGIQAQSLAVNPLGVVTAQFQGYGVGVYLPAFGWQSLTPSNASLVAVGSNGDVVAQFPGYGVEEYALYHGWYYLTDRTDASALVVT